MKNLLLLLFLICASSLYAQVNEIIFIKGRVYGPSGNSIAGVSVDVYDSDLDTPVCQAVSDEDGYFVATYESEYDQEEFNGIDLAVRLSAEGFAVTWYQGIALSATEERDFKMYDSVTFKAGRQSSLILPVTPDPQAGAYYMLKRLETTPLGDKGKDYGIYTYRLVFVRTYEPEANIPYLFIPFQDYTVRMGNLDLSVQPQMITVGDVVHFIGAYESHVIDLPLSYKLWMFDTTEDCRLSPFERNFNSRIGALHGYVIIENNPGMNAGAIEIILEDDSSFHSIADVNSDNTIDISDIVAVINVIAGTAVNSKADVNADGKTDISDIVAIINSIAK